MLVSKKNSPNNFPIYLLEKKSPHMSGPTRFIQRSAIIVTHLIIGSWEWGVKRQEGRPTLRAAKIKCPWTFNLTPTCAWSSHCAGTFTGRVRTRQYGTCSWTPEGRREDSSLLVNLLPGHKPLLGRIQLSVTRTLHYNLGKFFQEKSYTIINIKLGTKVNISLKREIITIAYFLKSW